MYNYEKIREEIFNSISSKDTAWTDYSENDIGTIIVSMVADNIDKLAYYLDKQKDEFYLSTAKERVNIGPIGLYGGI